MFGWGRCSSLWAFQGVIVRSGLSHIPRETPAAPTPEHSTDLRVLGLNWWPKVLINPDRVPFPLKIPVSPGVRQDTQTSPGLSQGCRWRSCSSSRQKSVLDPPTAFISRTRGLEHSILVLYLWALQKWLGARSCPARHWEQNRSSSQLCFARRTSVSLGDKARISVTIWMTTIFPRACGAFNWAIKDKSGSYECSLALQNYLIISFSKLIHEFCLKWKTVGLDQGCCGPGNTSMKRRNWIGLNDL